MFDKLRGEEFLAPIHSLAIEDNLYDFQVSDLDGTLEYSLSSLEGTCANIIGRILKVQSLAFLTAEERYTLSAFISVQFFRTTNWRSSIVSTRDQIEKGLRGIGTDLNTIKGYKPLTPDALRLLFVKMLIDAPKKASLFANKSWILYASASPCFYISDNPVVMRNNVNPRQHLPLTGEGLAVPGIEIYFPLARNLCLAMLCPLLEELIRKKASMQGFEMHKRHSQGFDSGSAIQIHNTNVEYINALHISQASRFLYSGNGDFGLVREVANLPRSSWPPGRKQW